MKGSFGMGDQSGDKLKKKQLKEKVPDVVSGDSFQGKIENKGVWKRFFHTCRVARIPYLTLIIYIALNIGQSTFMIYLPQVNADFFTGGGDAKSIAMFLIVELASMFVSQIVLYAGHIFRAKTDRNLRNALWGKILHLKPSYYGKVSASTLLSRITVDANSLNAIIMDVVLSLCFSIYSLVLTIVEMSSISMQAAIKLLVFVPIFVLFSFIMGRIGMRFESRGKFRMADLTSYLSELMASLPVIKACNMQSFEAKRGRKVIDNYYKAERNIIFLDVVKQIVSTVIGVVPEIAIIYMGIKMLKNSTLDPAGWYVFYIYAGTLIGFVSNLGSMWEQSKGIQGQLLKVSDVLYEEEESLDGYVLDSVKSSDIIFDGVSFGYDETTVLDNVSFTIPENKMTAIVGYSGAGKSTVLKLIERIYEPTKGSILVHGRNLNECDIKSWRDKIAYVTQNTPMISGTIRDNILYGVKREVSDEEIMQAASLAYIDKFINECEEKLDYDVGQFGSKLSGGQKQKISLARAILTNAEYLVLDEPTASLDIISASEVNEAIINLKDKKTIILVTHMADIISGADHIVVIDNEHRSTEGTHNEMLCMNGFYSELMKKEDDR